MLQPRLIYAGDTPLACTLQVEQTGPLTLTVRAGSLTTTGEARIVRPAEGEAEAVAAKVATGDAEWLPDGERLRVWLRDAQGGFVSKARRYTLAADVALPIVPDAGEAKEYLAELAVNGASVDVLLRGHFLGDARPAVPAGWQPVHWLVGPFVVPTGATSLAAVEIPVFGVMAGFPPGTGPADWLVQGGWGG